ncbi:CopG family antitoxin [Marinobacter sp. SS8-8]|uniref:CopG family antitoxin n=1 Tax=Marinobacter sp. SS8-8 TaxID=3050452 RepID=UPI0026DF4B3F|nr:CopG family antitoxin [Marinobacter sp. SS8-8]|tara:strand:+ start:872 stop:1447 length:576 start_codon:yes stop_codon:yes gene_type:complete
MKQINWNAEKNQQLMSERGVSFEDVLFALQSGGLLDDGLHPNRDKYPNQRLLVVRIDDYAWLVPYVENDGEIFLKTVIPSRKATKKFLGGSMAKTKLDPEEQELLEAYESGEFESDLDADRREYLTKAAEETFRKDKRINIRISSRDLEALQRRALEEGLPYQSLVSSVLHKYVSGGLKDISANKSGQRTR